MATTVHIDLQEGFTADAVVIRVNGQSILDEPRLTTRQQIGLARSLTAQAGDATNVRIEVELPARNARTAFDITPADGLYVAVSATPDGRLVHRTSREPFRYA